MRRGKLPLAVGLLVLAAWTARPGPGSGGLLGPIGPMAAQVQWVRARLARDAGLEGRSLALMESARSLSPRTEAAWISVADHMGLTLASAEGGRPGPERRAWLEGALEVLAEGEAAVRRPEELAFHAGVLLLSHAQTDPDLPYRWSDPAGKQHLGTDALWHAAAEAFRRAAALGHPEGAEAAAFAEVEVHPPPPAADGG